MERGKEDRQMGLWTGYYGASFQEVWPAGQERGSHLFKMGEL